MRLFGRRASLLLKAKGSTTGRDVSGLRCVFQVTKSNDPTANSAEIIVYNLAQDSITFAKAPNMQIFLSVGYDGGGENPQLKLIFAGDIYRQGTQKQGGDIITKFENADSLRALQTAKVNKSYKAGTPVSALLDEVVSKMGISKGLIQGLSGKQFVSGYSALGGARSQLDVIAQKTDTVWSIQDGVLQFIPVNGSTNDTAVLLTPDTGLIGSPNQKLIKYGSIERVGVEAVSLLQPEIKPGRKVEINSQNVSGVRTVQKVTHRGDTTNGPWFSEIEAV